MWHRGQYEHEGDRFRVVCACGAFTCRWCTNPRMVELAFDVHSLAARRRDHDARIARRAARRGSAGV